MSEEIRFYTDEHVPPAVADGLRRRGIDTLSARDAEMLGSSDEEHLATGTGPPRSLSYPAV